MYVTFAILIITAKKKLCNEKKTTSNVLKSQILDTLHILNFRIKLRWSFPMEQNAGIDSKATRAEGGRARTEILWMNYEPEVRQISLSI